jgi:hypothetical protein
MRTSRTFSTRLGLALLGLALGFGILATAGARAAEGPRAFATPEAAVAALTAAAKASDLDALIAIFGPAGKELVASSDAATARQNRDVFVAAAAERWRLVDKNATTKELVIGYEDWPFPVPLSKTAAGWVFDTAAGKEEVIDRRIGRNELATIRIAETYVAAQKAYARRAHDGKPAGLYARRFASDPGTQNGLYWPVTKGAPHSPLGALVAEAAAEGRQVGGAQGAPAPFHGYYFKILEAQSASAPGGARSYVANGEMSNGFALVAWPAEYDVTGIMTFIVNQDGVVYEKDLGPETAALVKKMSAYSPDTTWEKAEGLQTAAH